ncbi:hypothetical protein ACROYT_G000269 [Oculina patagonica]
MIIHDIATYIYPASLSLEDLKRQCPAFADKVCPFSKLPDEKKGVAAKCPEFKSGCPFKGCKTVGEFEDMLGQMRDQCKGDAAYVQFLRDTVHTAKVKEVDAGMACTFFQTKGGCPFAKDTKGKSILSPDYIVTPLGVTLNDVMHKCPAFGKGVCPYAGLVTECKGLAAKCPAFKGGCPFKNCKTVGEFVEKMTQMRDTCKGKKAYEHFFQKLLKVTDDGQKAMGACPFNAHVCPFKNDAQGKPIISK